MDSFICDCCCIELNNISTLEAHLAGKKHRRQKAMLDHRKEESRRSIFVTNLPCGCNIEQVLHEYFNKFGVVKNVVPDMKKRLFAIVEFADASAANKALRSVHWLEGKKLTVKEKLVKYPQPRNNRGESKEIDIMDELTTKRLLEKIRCFESIEEQMIVLQKELCLSTSSLDIRENIRCVLHNVLAHYFPNSELYLFGSSANGFGFEGCDVDLHLKLPISWSEIEDEQLTESAPTISEVETGNIKIEFLTNSAKLRLMKKIIQRYVPDAKQVLYIPSQRCPLLRFKYKYCRSELLCDLSIGKGMSVRNTILLWVYRNLDSRVLLLVSTLRWWAKQQTLIISECKFTSYAFIFLVIFFLQNREPPLVPTVEELVQLAETKYVIDNWNCSFCDDIRRVPKSSNEQSVKELLRDFFHFYATFDYTTNVISPRFGHMIPQSTFSSDPLYKDFKIGPICIQDPFILDRNIAGNFKEKYLQDVIKKFAYCEKLLSEANPPVQDIIAALMKEIPEESDVTEPISFSITSKFSMFKSMDYTSSIANLSEQQSMTAWLEKICVLVKDILERALCAECKIIFKFDDNKPQLTRKRSNSFCYEQQQKHFMRDSALQDREVSNLISLPSAADSSVQSSVPYIKIGNMGSKDSNINYYTNSNAKYPVNEEESEMSSSTDIPSSQKSIHNNTNEALCNGNILMHIQCKVNDEIWHQRKKESKKHKFEKRDILDVEHEISQTIIKNNANNKFFSFHCILQKHQTGEYMSIKVDMKPQSKNSFQKLKQFIVPFVSKLVDKCLKIL